MSKIKNLLTLKELKDFQDLGFNNNVITRERASDDMVFYWVTQWDELSINETELSYRGEFNIIRKAGRQISADLMSNPVQLNFDAKDPDREDGADLVDGLYLASERLNTCQEAFSNADNEAIVCGVGAYEYFTEYESNNAGDIKQVVRTRPVYEANNNCFWDSNAKLLDKSDANWVSILVSYSEEGYLDLAMELKGYSREEAQHSMSSFSDPQQSWAFPWIAGKNEGIYVSSFYHRTKVKDTIVFLRSPMGTEITMHASAIKEIEDELIDEGFEIVNQKKIDKWQVVKYIASGAEILSSEIIAGENLPVVPVYGERAFIEGEEHYEGVTRLAKDPQRLRNFQMSYLADMVSRSPRPKPIFNAEQVQGFEFMYEQSGADNNYPYYLTNRLAADGTPLAPNPAEMPEQRVPQALMIAMQESREAVQDVANAGLPNDIMDTDLSGKAVQQLQQRLDMQSIVYQENRKHARRRGGEIFASMASVVYDTPRAVTISKPDGTRHKVEVMESVQDKETGELVVLNDIGSLEFEVYADIGPSYSSKREQTIEQLEAMAVNAANLGDMATSKMLLLKQMTLVEGVAMEDIREYSRNQLIVMGVEKPDTPEEEQMLAQSQQQQAPSMEEQAEMVRAQADMTQAQGKVMEEQNKAANLQINAGKAQGDYQNKQDKLMSETELNVAKVRQDQQRINNEANNNQVKNAIEIARIEIEEQREMNAAITNNIKAQESYRPQGV